MDRSILDEVWVGDERMRQDVGGLFAAQSRAYLVDMDRALDAGDADGLQDRAHELKASSASVGAVRMAELCDRLCRAERDDVLGVAPEILRNLELASGLTQAAW